MIEFTEKAREKILELLQAPDRQGKVLRVRITGRGPNGFTYSMRFVDPSEKGEQDVTFDAGGFTVVVDAESAPKLEGAKVDYLENPYQSGFHIDNPNPLFDDPLAQKVQEVIETRINPGVAMHGGYVTLLDVRDNVAYVAMGGGCQGCGLAAVTLRQGVEALIREAVPEIQAVVDTTDHAAGTNPYYQPTKGGPPQGESPFAR